MKAYCRPAEVWQIPTATSIHRIVGPTLTGSRWSDDRAAREAAPTLSHRPRDQPPPLPNHPKQYDDEHGGIGSHCSTAATLVDDPQYPKKRYEGGTCNMFDQSNPTGGTQLFCSDCEPYLRLHDFSTLKG